MNNTDNKIELNKLINILIAGNTVEAIDDMVVKQLLERGKNNIISSLGPWNGEEKTRDIREDVINMICRLDPMTMPKYLIIPESDEKFLYECDSNRNTVVSNIIPLFGRLKNDVSCIIKSKNMPVGIAVLFGVGKENFSNVTSVVLINTRGNLLFKSTI